MENPDIDRPAVHIGFPFFAALFVASFFGAPFAAVSAVLLFAAVFLLLLFKQHRQRPNFVLSLIATAAAFAVFAVAMHLFVLPTERYDSGTYTVTGNVESFLTKSNGRFYYKLHVTHIDEPVQDVDFSVRLSHSEAFPAEIGDTVTCEAKFFAFEDSLGLSPRTSWLADNMVLSAYVTDYESVQVTPAEKRPFSYYVNQIRTHFHNLILENYPKAEGSVLSAMLLGLRDDMETELVSAYKKAGASHILAISGVHMAILTQFTLGFLGLLGLKRRPAALVSAVFTLLFMFVSGLSASVVRSGIMQLILLFGILLGRQAEPLNSLAVAVLTMSLLNPFCVGDVSLLFSFSATLGIILLAPRITKAATKNIRKPQRKAHLAKLVS
ncbi:MAG: ComEC/Rec2 family competence protein, partial [Hominenteromicrobium mulieris]